MKAMIFAAGLGTRLKPITDTLPKALVPVCGRPLMEHVMHKLMAAGITESVVNVHHFADKVEEWIGSQGWICRDAADMTEGKMKKYFSNNYSLNIKYLSKRHLKMHDISFLACQVSSL